VVAALLLTGCQDASVATSPAARMPSSAVAQASPKAAVCHAAGRADAPNFVEVSVGGSALAAHLDEHGTPRAGHEGDYLVTARTPCPPPPTAPNVRVCKVVDANMPAGRTFTFDVGGEAVTLAGGTCAERTFRVGSSVTITESVATGTALDAIGISPPVAGTTNVAGATATVVAGIDVAQMTFTNRTLMGQLTVCKALGPTGLVGRSFDFFVTPPGRYYSITPTTVGGAQLCKPIAEYPIGTVVTVFEDLAPSTQNAGIVTSIAVDPQDRIVAGSLDAASRKVSVTIGEGTTRVDFLNERLLVPFRICKESPAGYTGTTRFLVDAGWDGVFDVEVPANGCVNLTWPTVGPGVPVNNQATVHEIVPAGLRVAAITVDPPGHLVYLSSESVLVRTGFEATTVTFRNVLATP
jgi:hypothetical protein